MRAIKYSAAAPIATVRTLKKTLNMVSDMTVAVSFCGGGGGAASGAAGAVVVVVDPPMMLPRRPGVVVSLLCREELQQLYLSFLYDENATFAVPDIMRR